MVAVLLTAVATGAVGISAGLLLKALLAGRAQAEDLLFSAALLWGSNVLVFALWCWELDGGGPHRRHAGPTVSSDFLFSQSVASQNAGANWCPEFVDYLFLAFNTSTACSPTEATVLARRAKVLMLQLLLSFVTIAVFAARAINIL